MNAMVNCLIPVADITVVGDGGSPQPSYRYGAAIFEPLGGGVPPPGRVHFWLSPVWQVQICSGVPSAVFQSVTSRHLPDCGFTRRWLESYRHCCAPVPLQVHSHTRVPSAVPPYLTSMHLLSARRVPSEPTVHCCATVPLQVQSWIWVPSVLLAPDTSTHLPASPVICPVAASAGPAMMTRAAPAASTVAPRPLRAWGQAVDARIGQLGNFIN